jgi:hypothetical protein
VRYDTIRTGVLTLLNVGPRDPTLLHVLCGVCGKAAALSSTLTRPNGSSNSRRVLLVVSPSLRVGLASFARGSRHTREEAALLAPSPLRSSSSVPPAPPRLGTPGRSAVGPGTPLPASSLAGLPQRRQLASPLRSTISAQGSALRTSFGGACPRSYN